MAKSTPYQSNLIDALKDPCEAAAYLNAAIEEEDQAVFLLALRNVAEACGGMTILAEESKLSRERLHRTFSSHGAPEIKNLNEILHTMGLRLVFEPKNCECPED
jgi:probable addiction module antidote protein